MSDWGEGYVTDLQYVAAFCREQVPAMLRLAADKHQAAAIKLGALDKEAKSAVRGRLR